MRGPLKLYLVALSFVLGVTSKAAAQDPTVTTIDFPGAPRTWAHGINSAGEIVGRYFTIASDANTHGYLRSKEGEFTTIDFPGAITSGASDINDRGEISGVYRNADEPEMVSHGFVRSKEGEFTTIDFPGATRTNAQGINNRGDIVGHYRTSLGNFHGYLLSEGEFTSIDFPGATETHAYKINRRGEIVGSYLDAEGKFHGFLLSDGEFTTIDFPGAFETASSVLVGNVGINSRGDIVSGYCSAPPCDPLVVHPNAHGFLLSRGEFTTIDVHVPGATSNVAHGINGRGDIVGIYRTTGPFVQHGFLLSRKERDEDEDDDGPRSER